MTNTSTEGLQLGFTAADGSTFSMTFSGMTDNGDSDLWSDDGKIIAENIAKLVDGTLTTLKRITTKNVGLED